MWQMSWKKKKKMKRWNGEILWNGFSWLFMATLSLSRCEMTSSNDVNEAKCGQNVHRSSFFFFFFSLSRKIACRDFFLSKMILRVNNINTKSHLLHRLQLTLMSWCFVWAFSIHEYRIKRAHKMFVQINSTVALRSAGLLLLAIE